MSAPSPGPVRTTPNPIPFQVPRYFIELFAQERVFLAVLLAMFVLAAATYNTPSVAMWVGFAFAAYAATANDSIQTIGTFIASNSHRPWWLLWGFTAGIFLLTMGWSWWTLDGDVSYQRLTSKGFEVAPTSFSYLQVTAPLFLLILTRARVPVSTTFLCLSGFAANAEAIGGVVKKSVSGYVLAFVLGLIVFSIVARFASRLFQGEAAAWWTPAQWVTSGALWSVWLQQDAANIAVYLPRALGPGEFVAFCTVVCVGLLVLFRLKGDRIQEVVTEKSGVVDVRAATLIDLVYAIILYYFKFQSNIPMSTTWVFVGLLAGREIGIAVFDRDLFEETTLTSAGRMILKDIVSVTVGLIVSLIIAAAVNPLIAAELARFLADPLG